MGNPSAKLSKKKGIITAKLLIKRKANALLTEELGEGPFHVSKDNLIQI